jgi:2-polyprenyl-3-methyl-5-hydroxy-6-metoxy-1,4-benzoquinol methylase
MMSLFKKTRKKIKSDKDFLQEIYQRLLERDIDPEGKKYYLEMLNKGKSREWVILSVIDSEEFKTKITRENWHHFTLPPIRNEKPEQYKQVMDIYKKKKIWVFEVKHHSDFDWLEKKIIENGYYENPGVWNFQIGDDQILLSELISQFNPKLVLDLGCANGSVMKCLHDRGIKSQGIEISQFYLTKAFPEIEENIHSGDILEVNLEKKYDFILGLDIFEHLNPNKLSKYIEKLFNLLTEKGYLFCNIPAFGKDSVFGEIFPVYIKDWEQDMKENSLFQTIHTNDYGYPKNGHLIGADSKWWVKQFEDKGFIRQKEIEKSLHNKYDKKMDQISIARKSYYVFTKNP